jgi:hypothetical protein
MKVLLVNKFFFLKGGSETALFDTANILKKNGQSVAFFSMDHPKNHESPYTKYFVSNVEYEGPVSLSQALKASTRFLHRFCTR